MNDENGIRRDLPGRRPRGRSFGLCGVALLVLLGGLAWLAGISRAEEQAAGPVGAVPIQLAPTQPDSAAASQLDVDSMFEDPYPGTVGPRPEDFDEHEWDAILQIKDASSGCDEEAFYLLNEKANDIKLSQATAVTYEELKRDPKKYRATPIRITLQCYDTVESATVRPKRLKKVFNTRGFVTLARNKYEPVTVVSQFAPPAMAEKTRFEVIGYFYKIQAFPAKGDPSKQIEVPVIIASRISPISNPAGMIFDRRMVVTIIALVLLIAAWLFIRTKLSRRPALADSGYRPLRFDMDADETGRTKPGLPGLPGPKHKPIRPPTDEPSQGSPS